MARTYVVTGAASGIGLATAARLESEGHRVVTVDLRDADVVADLSTDDGRARMVDQVAMVTDGKVDAVVASAGVIGQGRLDVQVDYFGTVATLAGLRPLLAAGDTPRAVALSSFAVLDTVDEVLVRACLAGDENAAVGSADALAPTDPRLYASAKRALARWVRREAPTAAWAGAGIALNTVGPGVVRTPMTSPLLDDDRLEPLLLAAVPMPFGGVLSPDAIAHHLVALTDPAMLGMTGQTIFLDGGADCLRRGDDVF